ncbi:hypothetical protein [Micromonospora taraxaci]
MDSEHGFDHGGGLFLVDVVAAVGHHDVDATCEDRSGLVGEVMGAPS